MKPSFTLLELPIVAGIIAIMVAVALPNYVDAKLRAQNADVQVELNAVMGAIYRYRVDTNAYPPPDLGSANALNRLVRAQLLNFTPIDKFKIDHRDDYYPSLYLDYRSVYLSGQTANSSPTGVPPTWSQSVDTGLCLSSVGPDGVLDTFNKSWTIPIYIPRPYDSSNGLRSSGEIFKIIRKP